MARQSRSPVSSQTRTAPSPLNLITSWVSFLFRLCKKRRQKKERPTLVNMMGLRRSGQLSARSKMGAKWLSKVKKTSQVSHKDSMTLSVMHLSPLGSQLSFGNASRIESVIDWDVVRRKYRELHGGQAQAKAQQENKDEAEADGSQLGADDASSLVGSQATLIASTS